MDPRHRDPQQHHHRQQQQQQQQQQSQFHPNLQSHNSNYNNNSSFNYQDNNLQSQDDFNQFFNSDPSPAFQNGWDSNSILDPQLQSGAFNQPSSDHWAQQPTQSIQQDGFSTSFGRSQNDFAFPSFGTPNFSSFPQNAFDPMTYSSNDLLDSNQFADTTYAPPSRPMQGATVSPAALESYPDYNNFSNQVDDRSPTPDRQTPIPSVEPQALQEQPNVDFYDEDRAVKLAERRPASKVDGDMMVIDPQEFQKVVKSQQIAPHVFVGVDRLESEDPRVVFPRIVPRKSATDVRRAVLAKQAGRPWKPTQHQLLKKIKIKLGAPKSTVRAQAVAAVPGVPKPEVVLSSDSSSEESSDNESSDHSDSEEEAEPEEPSPLPSSRPTDPTKALEYDAIKAVWAKKSAMLPGSTIRTALSDYWNIARGVRDAWRSASNELQQAEHMKDDVKSSKSKTKLADQRQIFEKVVSATVKHGHPDILERFGEIPQLIAVFYMFIADRFKASDYNAPLIRDCLKLMCGCSTIDQALFEKTKLDKVVPKLSKKGNDEIKKLADELVRNVAKATTQKGGASKPKEEVGASPSKNTPKPGNSESISGVKRPRASDAPTLPAKKATLPLAKSATLVGKTANGTAPKPLGVSKNGVSVKAEGKTSAGTAPGAVQPKVKHVIAKPSSLLAGLQSASKKPGTSIAAQKASQSSDGKASKPESKPNPAPTATPKMGFSFSETLANLGKTKPAESVKQATEDRPNETEEEKRKRLRKEERRKLRVKFKPGESLVEVKVFHHDPEEELGHDDNMIRDVADVSNEGRMLKMHKDLEVDDDDDGDIIDLDVPWHTPSEVDFSDIDYDIIIQNFTNHGGQMEVESPEREKQEQREKEKFVVIYASLGDIPPNPREPLDPYTGDSVSEMKFGDPTPETRAREARFYEHNSQYRRAQAKPQPAPVANVNQLLSMLQGGQPAPQQPPPPPQQAPQAPSAAGLEAIFAQFSAGQGTNSIQMSQQNQSQQQPQPQQQQQQPQVDQSIMNALNIFNMQQHQQPAQQQQQHQPQQQQQQQQQPAQHTQQQFFNSAPATTQTPDLSALLASMGGQATNTQNNEPSTHFHENPDRKRQWQSQEGGDSKRFKGEKLKYQGVPIFPCKFYKEGKCRKGENCTFLHN